MGDQRIDLVKVFSATRSTERDRLGDRVTTWLRGHPDVTIMRTIVLLSSDARFHCFSIVLLGSRQ
jgi:hypothetical protein